MNPAELTKQLIACPSVSPGDRGCWEILERLFRESRFDIRYVFDGELRHLVATIGDGSPHVGLSGHVDVVPPGPSTEWLTPPFEPIERDGFLYGRGAADMKGGIACLTLAAIRHARRSASGRLTLLFTCDEEGSGQGARVLAEQFANSLDFVLVGEPTSLNHLGDEYKIGRRGSISAAITVHGKQGHTAYAHLADNPIHRAVPFLAELANFSWDQGDDTFPPTSLQISSIEAGAGAGNVIPGELSLHLNVRNSLTTSREKLISTIDAMMDRHGIKRTVKWSDGSEPFVTHSPCLIQSIEGAIEAVVGAIPRPSTAGGTSDGRWFAAQGIPTIEFGAINATIHAANERTPIADLDRLTDIYVEFLARIFASAQADNSVD